VKNEKTVPTIEERLVAALESDTRAPHLPWIFPKWDDWTRLPHNILPYVRQASLSPDGERRFVPPPIHPPPPPPPTPVGLPPWRWPSGEQ
jgi:hypothetical protein